MGRKGGLDLLRLHRAGEPGDILIFLPGAFEIARTVETLRATLGTRDHDILPLHGELPPTEQDRAVDESDRRKIIVATNVAETSLTIPGVRIVIERGGSCAARSRSFEAHRQRDVPRDLDLFRPVALLASSSYGPRVVVTGLAVTRGADRHRAVRLADRMALVAPELPVPHVVELLLGQLPRRAARAQVEVGGQKDGIGGLGPDAGVRGRVEARDRPRRPCAGSATTRYARVAGRAILALNYEHVGLVARVQNGTPLFALQELAGWETEKMVRRYAHLATDHLAAYAVKLRILGTNWSQTENV